MEPVTVLLVCNQEIVRRGLRAFFQSRSGIGIVGETPDVATATRQVREMAPQVVLIDCVVPGFDCVAIINKIFEAERSCQILVYSCENDEALVRSCINAGATACVSKNAPLEELARVIRTVVCDQASVDGIPLEQDLGNDTHGRSRAHSAALLTPREASILRLVARGYTNRAISNELGISAAVVKGRMSSILHKLNARHRTQAAVLAMRQDLISLK